MKQVLQFLMVKKMVSSTNISDIAGLFQGNNAADSSNPVVQKLTEQLAINLGDKFGLSSEASSGVAVSLIPNVLISLVNKVKYPNYSSFQISDVIGAISDIIYWLERNGVSSHEDRAGWL